MDIQAYIASGILENYVLGLTSEQETAEVASNLIKHPELRSELRSELHKIEDALAAYA